MADNTGVTTFQNLGDRTISSFPSFYSPPIATRPFPSLPAPPSLPSHSSCGSRVQRPRNFFKIIEVRRWVLEYFGLKNEHPNNEPAFLPGSLCKFMMWSICKHFKQHSTNINIWVSDDQLHWGFSRGQQYERNAPDFSKKRFRCSHLNISNSCTNGLSAVCILTPRKGTFAVQKRLVLQSKRAKWVRKNRFRVQILLNKLHSCYCHFGPLDGNFAIVRLIPGLQPNLMLRAVNFAL